MPQKTTWRLSLYGGLIRNREYYQDWIGSKKEETEMKQRYSLGGAYFGGTKIRWGQMWTKM